MKTKNNNDDISNNLLNTKEKTLIDQYNQCLITYNPAFMQGKYLSMLYRKENENGQTNDYKVFKLNVNNITKVKYFDEVNENIIHCAQSIF